MKIDTGRFTFGVLTMSDKGSRGEREDTSGPFLVKLLTEEGYQQKAYTVIPDQVEKIRDTLVAWVDDEKIDLLIASTHLECLLNGETSPANLKEARAYLAHKGFKGISAGGAAKTGDDNPILRLANWAEETEFTDADVG